MAKKSSLLAAAVAVIALAVPAFASATGAAVTLPAGTLLPQGATLVGTSHNTTIATDLGLIECGTFTFNAELVTNNGSTVRAAGKSVGTSTCTVEGEPVTFDNAKLTELHATSTTFGTAVLSFALTLPGGIICEYSGSAAVTYTSGANSLHITGDLNPVQPVCGIGHIDGDFAITSGGNAVFLD